jgi:aspartate racemase
MINETVRDKLGGLHSARIILYSVNFEEIQELQRAGDWKSMGRFLAQAAKRVEAAGAEILLLCTNTMHKLASDIEREIGIRLLHIADTTAEAIKARGITTVGLLGTRFTMEEDFYRGRLRQQHGLEVLVPEEPERELVDRIIFEELCVGRLLPRSRERLSEVIQSLADHGARGVILGCTEIPLLVRPEDSPLPAFDTTAIHAQKAVDWALADF